MLFSALPEEVRAKLRDSAHPRHFGDDQIIQQRGERGEGFWLIEKGSVAVGQFLPQGDFRGVALLGPGDSLGELAMFTGGQRVVDAVSRGESTLRFIRAEAFESALADDPRAMRGLLTALSRQLQEMLDIVAGIRRGSAGARIASMMATMAGGQETPVELAITQQELGELLGVTRATVSAALRELEQSGVVSRGYGTITVLDTERLLVASV